MKRRLPLYLDCTPMTRQQVCVCCHAVRGCKGCCKTCPNECNSGHDCVDMVVHGGVVCLCGRRVYERDSDKSNEHYDRQYDSR